MAATQYPSISSLNRRIIIQQVTEGKSTNSGAVTESWSTFKTVYAAVDFRSGTEEIENNIKLAKESKTFTIRYFDGITTKMRVSFNGQYYNINSIGEIGINRYLKLYCKAVIQ